MDRLSERLEVQTVVGGDNDLTVNHASFWQLGRRDQSGKYRVIGRSLRLPSSTCSTSSVSRFGVFPTVTHGDWRALRV